MIYQLALAEGDPSISKGRQSSGAPSPRDSGDVPEGQRMRAGEAYTVSDLLLRMIAFSDNDARALLMEGVPPAAVNAMMRTFHADMSLEDGQWVTSARSYAALFRILYNATFLSRAMSEYALGLLSQSHYQGALRRFIPEDVTIASKYGYFRNGAPATSSASSTSAGSCMSPAHPYMLCVMTRSDLSVPGGSGRDRRQRLSHRLADDDERLLTFPPSREQPETRRVRSWPGDPSPGKGRRPTPA
jgi:hypothetical protein